MDLLLSRRALFLGIVPSIKKVENDANYLEKGQLFNTTVRTDNFELKLIVQAEKGAVLTSEQIKWFDPIEKEPKLKLNNQIFICGDVFYET